MNNTYDVIIIGAGSVGVPAAWKMAEKHLSVLVIDSKASPGQGANKAAIGGIRATHSDKGKITVGLRSLEIFSSWEEEFGFDIEWKQGGYSFPVYNEKDEKLLKDLLKIQKRFGLNINWINADEFKELVPGINPDGLRGGTFSPGDGSANNLLAVNGMYFQALENGAEFLFNEKVLKFEVNNEKIEKVITDKGEYSGKYIINAAGKTAAEISALAGIDIPIKPDLHEAGITEPVKTFFRPMVVDMRPSEGSKNYYFYQKEEGQIVFCITPDPPIYGDLKEPTSEFLPMVSKRMVNLLPRLKNLKIRRVWRGYYPMTPDGSPIVGKTREVHNLIHAVGMCGQGFMLGPGLALTLANLVQNTLTNEDMDILEVFSLYRDFNKTEVFK